VEDVIAPEEEAAAMKQPDRRKSSILTDGTGIVIAKVEFRITKGIEDATGRETEFATFEAEVSHKSIPAEWYLNGKKVEPSPKFQVFAEEKKHRLAVNLLEMTDTGEVKFVFRKFSSTAKLTVEPLPLYFTKRLEDQSQDIAEDAEKIDELILEVKVSKKGSKVRWFKDDKALLIQKGDRKYDLRGSGLTTKLVIKQVKKEDLGVYKSTYAEDTTECTLRLIEQPAKIIKSLEKKLEVREGIPLTLKCQTNKPAEGQWFKDGKPIENDENVEVSVVGDFQKLLIN
jgi:membrane carboxypeptidase/penicillin-binding protein PbpC